MLSSLFTEGATDIQLKELLICITASLILGMLVAFIHMYRNVYTKNFVITLAVLPVLVQSVIMLVNGNLGTGIAVLGAFSLIRFRSVAGGSREITSIFWSMGVGLATGMGYVSYIAVFSVIVATFLLVIYRSNFADQNSAERELKRTISEDLDYPELFNDIFEEFAYSYRLDTVRTTTMGSLYELRYILLLKDQQQEKNLIDTIRIRNGNLPVVLGKVATNRDEL
ncbi:DUF4956 domain-containing protein [Tetragenococcus halophilus]|uniref:DUF4956 domain-containing protein n=1 Tax=Tetragenococcus halophilus TaxID=51669 RepID=A0A3G5FHE4_TETHA|nr:DUF4956 domain-containing protein [Tetragenococcus halophilus]AYW49756.1 DUF4956 domain-containing protein [Tetragenococcus halophilus]GBD63338.1 putative uncharacterized protein [Tetragenococcus halophilus subsp. flandriensis]